MAGRASNGESTIYQDADGRWHGYVSVGFTLIGKPDRRHVTGKTRAVVVAKVRDLERKRDAGTINASPPRPSPTGWSTGSPPSPRAGCASGRWRATSPPSAST